MHQLFEFEFGLDWVANNMLAGIHNFSHLLGDDHVLSCDALAGNEKHKKKSAKK